MSEQNDLNQPSSQQQAASNAVATELTGVRHELRELKEQLKIKKMVTSNQIAVGILKAFGVFFLLYLIFVLIGSYYLSTIRLGPIGPSRVPQEEPQSPN
jgi:hypothetical protein